MHSFIIINQVLILGILIYIGFVATKTCIISESLKEGIALLVFKITLPLMIFTNIADHNITLALLKNGAMVIVLAYFSLFLLLLTGKLSTRIMKLNKHSGKIHTLHTVFGNHAFLGFPLINALFPGGEGLFYATLFYLVSTSLTWTMGIYVLKSEKNAGVISNLKNLLNRNTFAFFLGFLFMLLNIRLPGILNTPLSGLGQTTTYLSMLYIGAMLGRINLRSVFTFWSVFILCFNKLLLIPFILIIIIGSAVSFFSLELNHIAKSVVILQSGMPCAALIVVLAGRFKADEKLATTNLFVSTIMSLATLPLVYFLIEFL